MNQLLLGVETREQMFEYVHNFAFCNTHSSGYFAFCNVLKEWGVPQIKQLPKVPGALILGTPHSEDITLSFKLQGRDQ